MAGTIRYFSAKDVNRPLIEIRGRNALMTESYIDEHVEAIAWESGETIRLVGKLMDDGSFIVRSKRTGRDYIIAKALADLMLVEKIC